MTVAPEPTPTPPTPTPAAPQDPARPDLRLVPPPETAEEITGPIPVVVDAVTPPTEAQEHTGTPAAENGQEHTGTAVASQAPLDVRLLEHISDVLRARPRWSERPPSTAEVWEYSTTGDWTGDEKSAKRIFHGLCVLVAFGVTYPIDWLVQTARTKPIGFVLIVLVAFVATKTFS